MFIKISLFALTLFISHLAGAADAAWKFPTTQTKKVAVDYNLSFEDIFRVSNMNWLNRQSELDHPTFGPHAKRGTQSFTLETRSFSGVLHVSQVEKMIDEEGYISADMWQLFAYATAVLTENSRTDDAGKTWLYTPLVCALQTRTVWQEQILAPCVTFEDGKRVLVYTFLGFSVESRQKAWRDAWHEEAGLQGQHVLFLVHKK